MNDQKRAPGPAMATPNRPSSFRRPGAASGRQKLHDTLSTIAILLIAPLIAILLTAFVFQSYQVDGPSMETTLSNNDRLIVWKLPRTWAKITGHQYLPNRGDVIVFTEPDLGEFGQNPGKQLIKRVIGLPGERVVVQNNVMTVYNKANPEGFQPDATLPYGSVITGTNLDGEWKVGPDELFVSGDNRYNSLDSRLFGPIETKNIVGKLVLRVLPLNQVKKF